MIMIKDGDAGDYDLYHVNSDVNKWGIWQWSLLWALYFWRAFTHKLKLGLVQDGYIAPGGADDAAFF